MGRVKFGLLGAGGFAREVMPFVKGSVAKTLLISEENINVYFVETWQPKESTVNGYSVLSLDEFIQLKGKKYFNVAVGSGRDREAMVTEVGSNAEPLSLQAPQATIFDCNIIANGSVFCPNTMVTSNASIGKFFHCNIYAYVAHDCVIGDFVTFAPGVRCNGRVHIEDYAYIGTNAIIREGTSEKPLRIGKGAVVGMGAVVTKDVPAGATVVGNPARVMEKR
ncbi:MAG: NeuD/PglB/VioB family sugar acetyltransferase [Rhodoferax sp.]|nr:NeuD/PglB/VioB family sugar acetyltransferase [Rhodoferax sp.]